MIHVYIYDIYIYIYDVYIYIYIFDIYIYLLYIYTYIHMCMIYIYIYKYIHIHTIFSWMMQIIGTFANPCFVLKPIPVFLITRRVTFASPWLPELQVFPCGVIINEATQTGWFLLGKAPFEWMMTGGTRVPLFQETPMWFARESEILPFW